MKKLTLIFALFMSLASRGEDIPYTSEELCRIISYVPAMSKVRDKAQSKTFDYLDEKWQKIMKDAPPGANELRMREFEQARYRLWEGFCNEPEGVDGTGDVLKESARIYKECLKNHQEYSGSLYTSMEKVNTLRKILASERFREFKNKDECVQGLIDKMGKDESFFKGAPAEFCKKSVRLWNKTAKACGQKL